VLDKLAGMPVDIAHIFLPVSEPGADSPRSVKADFSYPVVQLCCAEAE
jgi:hypothetical protein